LCSHVDEGVNGRRDARGRGTIAATGVGRPGAVRAGAKPIGVAVLTDDAITRQGLTALLHRHPTLRVTPVDRTHEADVVLIVVSRITEDTLTWMKDACEAAATERRFVLVGDGLRRQHLLRAVSYGSVSVVPRSNTDIERVLEAVHAAHEGRLEGPDAAFTWLQAQLRSIHREILEPNGLTAAGLEAREIDVLRLLADGLSTSEISQRLNYSERTVQNIVHGVLSRLKLRNRAHAVSYALRRGAL